MPGIKTAVLVLVCATLSNGATPSNGSAAVCYVDTDCSLDEHCHCMTTTALTSPAAPLARTPLATVLSFVSILAACVQPSAATQCYCQTGARPGDAAGVANQQKLEVSC